MLRAHMVSNGRLRRVALELHRHTIAFGAIGIGALTVAAACASARTGGAAHSPGAMTVAPDGGTAEASSDLAHGSATAATATLRDSVLAQRGDGVASGARAGRLQAERMVFVALDTKAAMPHVTSRGPWTIDELGGRQRLVQGTDADAWRVERRAGLLRVAGEGSDATPWRVGPFVARAMDDGSLVYEGHRYRGELWFTATDSGVLVVNRLPVEEYLRGVVPLELGTRLPTDRAALEAQAVAARSYTYIRVPSGQSVPPTGWNVLASVTNQVYGGADAEHAAVDDAIRATAGLVLRYGGLTVDAPYSSSCGGRTAVPTEAWRGVHDQPYLASVDDTDPRTGRPYCDLSPRNHWTQDVDAAALEEAVRRALVASGAGAPMSSRVRDVSLAGNTPSGRVTGLVVRTDRGDVTIRAQDVRAAFRSARGAILPSTYFSVDRGARADGASFRVTLRGAGNGHGVGLCQWGAIGRSRQGQSARQILQHYYPGTIVGFAD